MNYKQKIFGKYPRTVSDAVMGRDRSVALRKAIDEAYQEGCHTKQNKLLKEIFPDSTA